MILGILRFLLLVAVALVALVAALAGWLLYTPGPEAPLLSGDIAAGAIDSGGRARTYLLYAPKDLPRGAPLVIAMHGSGRSGAEMRIDSGYAFERLADANGFAVVYPDGFEGYWNACNIIGDYAANTLDIDDVGFLTALAEKLFAEIGADPARVYATGLSRGGHMAFRLALEAPGRFRAVAAIAANVPAPENFKCKPAGEGTSSVMIMNGRKDPLNPFEGGEVTIFGAFKRGAVLSSRESAQYFATLNGIAGAPMASDRGAGPKRLVWRNESAEIDLVAHDGGHVIPQPFVRYPRLLGPTPKTNGPELIWEFFERQAPQPG